MDGQNFDNNQFNKNFNAEQPVQQQPIQQPTQQNFYQDNTAANTNPYTYTQQQQVPPVYSAAQPQPQQSNALSIVSLVMGILSILFGCCYGIGILFAIAGIICAAVGKKKGQKGGIGTAGLVCSIIGAVLSVIMLIYVIIVGVALFNDPSFMNELESIYY